MSQKWAKESEIPEQYPVEVRMLQAHERIGPKDLGPDRLRDHDTAEDRADASTFI
jgi:hypothetical protein